MTYPLIILGAGASYDYVDPSLLNDDPPPMTDHLVSGKYVVREIADRYPEVYDLISTFAPRVNPSPYKRMTLEQCMSQVKNREHLIAFQFYLKDLFSSISERYIPTNNYRALKYQIDQTPQKGACVVSFNYDTLFDQAIGSRTWQDMRGYTSGPIKLIKVHGCCQWSYPVEANPGDKRTPFEDQKRNKNFRPDETPIHLDSMIERSRQRVYRYPALAIPAGETKTFVCPEAHIELLRDELRRIDRILVIGWKAGDPHLIRLLEQNVNREVAIAVVSGNQEGVDEVVQKLAGLKKKKVVGSETGFSKFIASQLCAEFFDTEL